MTDKTGNRKIRVPQLAIGRTMIAAGKARLDALTSEDCEQAGITVTDDLLVAEVFLAMWNVYWEEVMAVQRRKDSPANVLLMPDRRLVRPQ